MESHKASVRFQCPVFGTTIQGYGPFRDSSDTNERNHISRRGKRLKELGLSSLEKRLKEGIGGKEGCSPENKGESAESI